MRQAASRPDFEIKQNMPSRFMATSTNWPGASTLSPSGRARVRVREQRAPRPGTLSCFHPANIRISSQREFPVLGGV